MTAPRNLLLLREAANPGPPASEWALFNGTASVPYSAIGTSYTSGTYETYVTVALNSTQFLAIYGGTYGTCFCAVGTYGTPGSQPTFGTPVQLDTVESSADIVTFDAIFISSGVVYIDYNDPQGGNKKGVIALISGSTITLQTPVIISATAKPIYPGNGIAFFDSTHVITAWQDTNVNLLKLVSITINNDNTLTVNTPSTLSSDYAYVDPGNQALACTSDNYLVMTLFNFAVNKWQVASFPITSGGTVIGALQDSLNLADFPSTYSSLCHAQGFQFFAAYGNQNNVSGTNYNVSSFTCTNGNLVLGKSKIIFIDLTSNELPITLVQTNNSNNQVLVAFSPTAFVGNILNQAISCLTPFGINNFTSTTPSPVNANSTGTNSVIGKACALSDDVIIWPAVVFDGTNYGLSVLQIPNAQALPYRVFTMEAGVAPFTINPSSSLGNTSGTRLSHTLHLTSATDYTNYLVPGTEIVINTTDHYTVASSSYDGTNNNVITVETLSDNYFGVPFTVTLLADITTSPNAIVFSQSDATLQPSTAVANLNDTYSFYGNFANSRLENSAVPFPISYSATVFMVLSAVDGAVYVCAGVESAGISYILEINSMFCSIQQGNINIGNYTINNGLTLITLLRNPLNENKVWVNGVLNDSNNTYVSAIGNFIDFVIGTRPDLAVPLEGQISYLELWAGAMSDAAIAAKNAELIAGYNIGS